MWMRFGVSCFAVLAGALQCAKTNPNYMPNGLVSTENSVEKP